MAFDTKESLPLNETDSPQQFDVKVGDEKVLNKYKNRALLIVYPPPGPAALQWTEAHNGKMVIYCGEGRGGVNADQTFFDALETNFEIKTVVKDFEPFGTKSFERMWVLQRKKV